MNEGFYGMRVENVRTAATDMLNGAGEVNGLISTIGKMLEGLTWEGPDAKKFRTEWAGTFHPNLKQTIATLQAQATQLNQYADAQAWASGEK